MFSEKQGCGGTMTAGSFIAAEDTAAVELKDNSGGVKARNLVYFGKSAGSAGYGPQSFMVEHPKGRVGAAHFHNVDQYQVFFPSAGATYKQAPIDSPIFHYTDAYTVYGPYAAGDDQPLRSLTLRARHSRVTAFVPAERDKLPKADRARRHVTIALGPARPMAPAESEVRVLIEPYADGLAAYLIEAGPDVTVAIPPGPRSGGEYCCVLDGSVLDGGRAYTAQAVRWDEPGQGVQALVAGDPGMRVLVMRFPDPPASDPGSMSR
jgi:hypothetical protein